MTDRPAFNTSRLADKSIRTARDFLVAGDRAGEFWARELRRRNAEGPVEPTLFREEMFADIKSFLATCDATSAEADIYCKAAVGTFERLVKKRNAVLQRRAVL